MHRNQQQICMPEATILHPNALKLSAVVVSPMTNGLDRIVYKLKIIPLLPRNAM